VDWVVASICFSNLPKLPHPVGWKRAASFPSATTTLGQTASEVSEQRENFIPPTWTSRRGTLGAEHVDP
jgi:hypothetical protein